MTILTAPVSLTRDAVRPRIAAWARRMCRPAKPVLVNLAKIPFTAAGFGCADFAAFHLAHGWGWLATGLSLVLLEHLIADED